jgi:hypothetical protein
MIAVLHFTTLVITTLFAAAAAALVNWLLLRATFQLMRPATAGRASTGPSGRDFAQSGARFRLIPVAAEHVRTNMERRSTTAL